LIKISARGAGKDYHSRSILLSASGHYAWKDQMTQVSRNNRLMPWYIGIIIILAAVSFVGYQMWATSCPAPTIIELGVLTVIPIVYLVLMYLTLVSQK
jgi:hypothetical protein